MLQVIEQISTRILPQSRSRMYIVGIMLSKASPLSFFFHQCRTDVILRLVLDRLGIVDRKTLGCKHDVELELAGGGAAGALVLAGGRVVLDGVEVDHEVVLDGEDGVGGEPGVVFGVDLGDDGLVAFVCDLGVRVSWTFKSFEELSLERLTIRWM